MELGWVQIAAVAAAALMIGFTKTGLPGVSMLVVPLMATTFDARASVGIVLPLLIVGDVFAVSFYKRHAQWEHLRGLFFWVILGMIPAYFLLDGIGKSLGPILGCLVLALLGLDYLRVKKGWEDMPHRWWFVAGVGFMAGFCTTIGNVAGPVMAIYLISRGLPKREFMGTAAWYFLCVNLIKVPVFASLDMITWDSLRIDLFAAPAVVVGALIGYVALPKIPQKVFNTAVLGLAAIAALNLVLVDLIKILYHSVH